MKIIIFTMLLEITTCLYDRRTITTFKYSKYYVKPMIVNGEPAAEGQVPYLISIKEPVQKLSSRRIVWKNLCGASIIGDIRVITAAHCFEGSNFFYAKHPGILRLVAGNLKNDLVHDGMTETTKNAQWRKIRKVVLHRDFGFPTNDIALVFVNEEWKFNSNVDYIPVATRNTDYPRTCYSAGYGRTGYSSSNGTSPVMLIARIDVMSRLKCSMLWEMNMNSFICTDSVITDVARGDSGGPLACSETLDPAERSGKSVLVGVVSGKNFDKTTLYTRISSYRDWIQRDGCKMVEFNRFLILIIWLSLIYLLFCLK